jgi:glycosyltransferase involved in cell wall biosynthesis
LLVLGAGLPVEHVLSDFSLEARGAVSVVSAYQSEELPGLLSSATVGAFPGYLEGFGFGILEMLAAGLPTIAYDAPGSRDILGRLMRPTMVAAGETEEFARLLAETLVLSEERYTRFAEESDAVARTFAWREIALRTRAAYVDRLTRLRAK